MVSIMMFMLVVDEIRLSPNAKAIYQQAIGRLMAAKPSLCSTVYLVCVFGLLRLAIKPNCALAEAKQFYVRVQQ